MAGALLFFQEYKYFTPHGAIFFFLGNAIAIVSVLTMAALRLKASPEPDLTEEDVVDIVPRRISQALGTSVTSVTSVDICRHL